MTGMRDRLEYARQVETRLSGYRNEIDAMLARDHRGESREKLEGAVAAASEKLDALRRAPDADWEQARTAMEKAAQELDAAYTAAKARLHG